MRVVRQSVNGVRQIVSFPLQQQGSGNVPVTVSEQSPGARAGFSALGRFFLPAGFPASVSGDYLSHQAWTGLKNVASAASYVLATSCLLQAVGVHSSVALPLGAAANWVLRDGLGSLGVMVAASRFGRAMDAHLRRARWVAELGMVIGVALEMTTPLLPPVAFLPVASLANVFKGLSALTGGASKASFHRHFARHGNLADVTAQSHSQHTAAYTLGTSLGVLLTLIDLSPWIAFLLLSSIQMFAVRQATMAVALSTLDAQRGPMLVQHFLDHHRVPSPDELRLIERFEWPFVSLFRLPHGLCVGAPVTVFPCAQDLDTAIQASQGRPFLLYWDGRIVSIVLQEDASDASIIEALFEACKLAQGRHQESFEEFRTLLLRNGWSVDECSIESSSGRTRVSLK